MLAGPRLPHTMPVSPNSESNSPLLARRRALGLLGTSSLALFASSSPASAFFFGRSRKEVDLSGLNPTWVRLQGRNLERYADFLADLRLKHVTPRQVIESHAKRRGSVWNTLPPRSMWRRMETTLKAVDRIAAELGRPVEEVVSAYRSPAYNARCAGASRRSWHQANVALDLKFETRPSTVAAVARRMRSRGLFRGGIGRYYGFTHIDTRGTNVDW